MNAPPSKPPVPKKVTRRSIDSAGPDLDGSDDLPFEPNVPLSGTPAESAIAVDEVDESDAEHAELAVSTDPAIDEQFIGRWNRLISYSNWEKGRIILQWRQAAIDAGADVSTYSDEAWARKVEGVSPQHVGRLRRVYTRFGQDHESYKQLYWTHFLAALDWDDAPMWLEGASRSGWSVSQMRRQRWEATGAPAEEEPTASEIVAADYDEDYQPVAAVEDQEPGDRDDNRGSSGPLNEGPDFGETEIDTIAADDETFVEGEVPQQITAENPFQRLPKLPEDVADAMEQMKLAIVRHRCRGWEEIAVADVLQVLDALKQFAAAGAPR